MLQHVLPQKTSFADTYDRLLAAVTAEPADNKRRLELANWLQANSGTKACVACHGGRNTPIGKWSGCLRCGGSGRESDGFAVRALHLFKSYELTTWEARDLAAGRNALDLVKEIRALATQCREHNWFNARGLPVPDLDGPGNVCWSVRKTAGNCNVCTSIVGVPRCGFVERLRLPVWAFTPERVTGLFASFPIRSVRLDGAAPWSGNAVVWDDCPANPSYQFSWWWPDATPVNEANLPDELIREMASLYPAYAVAPIHQTWMQFNTLSAARAALDATAVSLGRKWAKQPPLPVPELPTA